MNAKTLLAIVIVCCVVRSTDADWLRFRGPNGNGTSNSTIPISWTPTANLAWKAPLPGAGVSSPIVVGNRVFVTSYSGYGLDRSNPGEIEDLMRHLTCFDIASGEKLWQKDLKAKLPEDPYTGIGVTAHGYASHSPVSDGERVYVYFGKSGAYAFDLDGNQLWHSDIGTESDPWKWGSSASPIVHDDLLIVTASAEGQAIVGLDAKTGEELWRQEAAGLDGMWGTPVVAKLRDGRTDLVFSVAKEMWGLDPSTGKLRWFCNATGADQVHSSPVAGGGTIYALTGRGGGSVAIKAGGSGDVTDTHVVWSGTESTRFATPVGHKTNLYLIASGVASVIDTKTGKRIKQARLRGGSSGSRGRFGGSDYASPVIAGDKLYYVNGKGETFVFDLDDKLTQLSVNLVTTDAESFGGTPAVSDNRFILRSNKHLYCVAGGEDTVEPNASSDLIAKSEPAEENRQARGERGSGRRGGGAGRRGRFDPVSFFERLDKNDDKKLTKEEVEGSPTADRFADFDKNNDDGITLEEFQDSMRAMFRGGGRGAGGRGGRRGGPGGREDNRPKRPQRPEMAT